MKEAIGGVLSLNIILIFLVIISCYLAFSVNYTKAYRVKNEIRSIIEKNEGLTCDALDQINRLMQNAHYDFPDGFATWCERNGYVVVSDNTNNAGRITRGGFCYKVQPVNKLGTSDDETMYKGAYYTVATFVNVLDLPMFGGSASGANDLMNFLGNTFVVKGETALIYSSGLNYEGLPSCTGLPSDYGNHDRIDDGYIQYK